MAATAKQLERSVALIRCGNEQASAFFITSELVITTRHSIVDHLDDETVGIYLYFLDSTQPISALPSDLAIPVTEDMVVLRVSEPVDAGRILPLMASHLPRGLRWESFGFPGGRSSNGARIKGAVSRWLPMGTTPRDVELECDDFKAFTSYKGFSGAPVVTGDHVTAILQRQLDGALGAVSILRLRQYLDTANVPYASLRNIAQVPIGLRNNIEKALPNTKTFWALEDSIHEVRRGYLILSGNPGAGKTFIVAGFQPSDRRLLILGRYFSNTDGGISELPPEFYRDGGTFAAWLSIEASLVSGHAVASTPDHGMREHIRTVNENLRALATYCVSQGTVGVLFIDDALPSGAQVLPTSLVRTLPPVLPEGLVIVLSVSNQDVLQSSFPDLTISSIIPVAPLERYTCEQIARRTLGEVAPESVILKIADMSEGNPLILSYLIREVHAALDAGEVIPADLLVASATTADAFYRHQWRRISSNDASVWLVALIARLRGSVQSSELVEMLPDFCRASFPTAWLAIQHLVHEDGTGVRIYHASFREFALGHTPLLNTTVHDRLAQYCVTASHSAYAQANLLYHHLRASNDLRANATQLCTQEWLDSAAVNCVPPAYILADIEELLDNTLARGEFENIIYLLLLRSRIKFRYNTIFGQFAAELSAAALALCGTRPALGLIIRNQHLLCSPDEVVDLLRRFLLFGGVDEATELFQIFRRLCVAAYEAGTARFPLLEAHIDAVALLMPVLGKASLVELSSLYRMLEANLSAAKSEASAADLLRSRFRALPMGQFLWRIGHFLFPLSGREDDPASYCSELTFVLVRARELRLQYGKLADESKAPPPPMEGFKSFSAYDAAAEIEALCEAGGVLKGAERDIADVLIRHTRASQVVARLAVDALPASHQVALRQRNGVDPDLRGLDLLHFATMVAAYIGDETILSRFTVKLRHSWENRFIDAFKWVAHACGRWYGLRRDNKSSEKRLIEEIKTELMPLIEFSLAERASWADAYNLPEAITPELFARIAELVSTFEPASARELVQFLKSRFDGQLGLYTEGFRHLLRNLAAGLRSSDADREIVISLRRVLFDHIRHCVLNRIERVPELLECAHEAALSGDHGLAEEAFRSAIDASLGPGWYKEDQFCLLMDTLTSINDVDVTRGQLKNAIETLEFASGDLTFQRFVRYQKQELIEHLATLGLVGEALSLFIHYVLPPMNVQKARIFSSVVDRTDDLTGSRFGVLEVDEQAASLALLRGLSGISPLRRWALVELFLPGDVRYFEDFARLTCELLSARSDDKIGDRFLRLLRADFAPDKRAPFVARLQRCDSNGSATRWISEAEALGILAPGNPNPNEDDAPTSDVLSSESRARPVVHNSAEDPGHDDELLIPGLFGRKEGINTLKESVKLGLDRFASGNKAGARESFLEGLTAAQAAGWGIWDASGDLTQALTGILQRTGSLSEGVRSLRPLIMKEQHALDWSMAHALIMNGVAALHSESAIDVLKTVLEHLGYVLRPEMEHREATYETSLLKSWAPATSDQAIDILLVALLDHPNQYVRERVADVIYWLVQNEGEFDINRLVLRALDNQIGHGREISAGLLHGLALNNPTRLVSAFANGERIRPMLMDPNYAIRYTARELLRILGDSDSILSEEAMGSRNTDPPMETSDLVWKWGSDAKVIFEIIGDEGSRSRATNWLRALCSDEGPEQIMKLWKIRRSGFGCRRDFWSTPWEREAVFRAVGDLQDSEKRRRLVDKVMWNPMWPDAELDLRSISVAGPILERLKKRDYENCFVVEGRTVLHCFEIFLDQRREKISEVEIIAFIVPPARFNGHFDFNRLAEHWSVHGWPEPTPPVSSLALNNEPAIVKFTEWRRIGGDLTPARPTQRLLEATRLPITAFHRLCWHDGRLWDPWGPGPAIARGCALLVDPNVQLSIAGVDLVWAIFEDGSLIFVVDPNRQRVYSPKD